MSDSPAGGLARRTGLAAADEALLAALPLFEGLEPALLRTLLADASVRRHARHTTLFLQGEPADRFYVVLDGWVKLFRATPDGHETVIAAFTRGESFAEAASFAEGVFPVSAEVVEEARLLSLPTASFVGRLRKNPALAVNMLASMSRHLRGLVQQVEQRTVESTTRRLSAFLLKLCPEEHGSAAIDLPTEKALVAARLGMRPETLSRALAKLRALGLETHERQVVVPDIDALRRFAESGRSDSGVTPGGRPRRPTPSARECA